MNTTHDHTAQVFRAAHHAALATLDTTGTRSGISLWRSLRRIEARMTRANVSRCNDPGFTEADHDQEEKHAVRAVRHLLGALPPGFHVNRDPRGYALKISPPHVPAGMATDLGRDGALAAEIQ